MSRLRTNIEIEETFLRAVMDRYGIHTKTEAVDLALRHLAGQPMTRDEALAMQGARRHRGHTRRHRPSRHPVILADTSAWVEYDRGTRSDVDRRIAELIGSEGPLAVTEPVVMEVVAGARSDQREADLRRLLGRCHLLGFDAVADFDAAGRIYRQCRRAGVTPRGLVDCMIASVAHRHGASLLAHDTDLSRVATVMGIELDRAS